MNSNQSVNPKQRSSDMVGNRMALYITLTFAFVIALTFLYRAVETGRNFAFFNNAVMILGVTAAVMTAVSVWRVVSHGGKGGDQLVTPGAGLFVSLFLLASCGFLRLFYNDAVKMLFVLTPAICVVYLIGHVYGNGFYPVSAFLVTAAAALYIFRRMLLWGLFASWKLPFAALLLALACLWLWACLTCKKEGGTLKLGKRELKLFKKQENYLPAWVAGGVVAAAAVVFAFSPSQAAFYGLMAIGAVIVLLAVYYTSGLMYH